ncbi:MAG: iron-sulfur cluster repair di-iron protein [Phycisphaeraceae bacterium]|nr:iron-sulfur cluster repair di-iron protein [Phycisphaeraceae bacterium]
MDTITTQTTVGDMVRQRPSRSRVFERLQIDFCCGGKLTLRDACAAKSLDAADVLRQLLEADEQQDQADARYVDADAMGLAELADHIVQTHHAYLCVELPRLDQMTARVHQVHGDKDSRLADVRDAFVALRQELQSHMMKEEQILFPLIRQMDSATAMPAFHCGSIAHPIRQMEVEHQHAGDALAIMNNATDGYTPPDWACNTYRAMLDGLAQLERDMHQHVHKENNVLFPKALALEARLTGKAGQ